MPNDDGLKGQLGRFFRSALNSAQNVADEVRSSAQRIREQLDNQQFQQEKRELFAKLGEETYAFYKKGREQVPQLLKEKIEQLDRIAGDVITKENLERAGEVVDGVVRGVVEDVNDFLEETIRARQREQERETCTRAATAQAERDESAPVNPSAALEPGAQPEHVSQEPKSPEAKPAPNKRAASRKAPSKTAPKKAAASAESTTSKKKSAPKPKAAARRPKKGPVLASDPLASLRERDGEGGE